MMNYVNRLIIAVCTLILLTNLAACDKDESSPVDVDEALVFELLTSDKDTLSIGEQAQIEAIASGTGLVYHWSASAGEILATGSTGATVTYNPTPCVAGYVKITCEIEDVIKDSEKKSINIYIE